MFDHGCKFNKKEFLDFIVLDFNDIAYLLLLDIIDIYVFYVIA